MNDNILTRQDGCFPYEEHRCNPRWPHKVLIYRDTKSEGNPWDTGSVDEKEFLYEGMGRSYRKSMTSYKESVMTNVRMVSVKGAVYGLRPNDIIEVDKKGYKEKGFVKDVNIYMNGRGTTIEWDYERV